MESPGLLPLPRWPPGLCLSALLAPFHLFPSLQPWPLARGQPRCRVAARIASTLGSPARGPERSPGLHTLQPRWCLQSVSLLSSDLKDSSFPSPPPPPGCPLPSKTSLCRPCLSAVPPRKHLQPGLIPLHGLLALRFRNASLSLVVTA